MQLLRELDGFFSIACFADHFHVGLILEHAPETAAHQAVVIHEQHCDLLFHKTPLSPEAQLNAPAFHLPWDAKKQSDRPSTQNARALPPGRCPACWGVHGSRCHDLQLPTQAFGVRNIIAPAPLSRPSAVPRYSMLPAKCDRCVPQRCRPPETVRPASHRIWQSRFAFPRWGCTRDRKSVGVGKE